jgi:hypothetical protein
MLHHISVSVNDPRHVATVMAAVFQGQVAPFPFNPGSYVTLAGDELGTMIEFYPYETEIIPNAHQGQAGFRLTPYPNHYTAFHAAISVPISLEEIERIGEREGWRVLYASRDGLFEVIEFWVENRLMIELLTPAMAAKYRAVFSPENLPMLVDQLALVETWQ